MIIKYRLSLLLYNTNTTIYISFRAFNSVCYSANGQFVIAGGQSKNVCIYNVAEGILLKKFEITQNQSFDAVLVSSSQIIYSYYILNFQQFILIYEMLSKWFYV